MANSLAWWMLSTRQKELLQQGRESGRFGGIAGKAPYMWVQEGSTDAGAAGAVKAGITPKHFIANVLNEGHQEIWGFIINDVLGR